MTRKRVQQRRAQPLSFTSKVYFCCVNSVTVYKTENTVDTGNGEKTAMVIGSVRHPSLTTNATNQIEQRGDWKRLHN